MSIGKNNNLILRVYKILKINLQKKKFFLESVLKDEISTTGNMIKLLIDDKNEELIIFSIEKENKNSYLYFYDKNNLTLKKTKTIKIPFSYSKSEEIPADNGTCEPVFETR